MNADNTQQPVAWMTQSGVPVLCEDEQNGKLYGWKPLYATPQPVIVPRKVYVNFYGGDVGNSQCYRSQERAVTSALGGPTETAVEFLEVISCGLTPQPVIAPKLELSGEVTSLTELKTRSIIEGGAYQITGYVLSNEDGKRAVVDRGAVRWIEKDAMWDLMHGPDTQPVIAPDREAEIQEVLSKADRYAFECMNLSDSANHLRNAFEAAIRKLAQGAT